MLFERSHPQITKKTTDYKICSMLVLFCVQYLDIRAISVCQASYFALKPLGSLIQVLGTVFNHFDGAHHDGMDYHFTIISVFHPRKSPVLSSPISVHNMESLIWCHHVSRLCPRRLCGRHLDSSCCKSIGRLSAVDILHCSK